MALSDLTFKLFNDSGLTSAFSGILQIVHETDLSDNPQDFQLFFGSNTADRKLEAVSNPSVDQITITPTDTLDDWTAATAYVLGDLIEPTTPNGLKYKCTTAGTSDATTEPTFPTSGIDGVAGAVEDNIRVTNASTDVTNNTGQPEVSVFINNVIESEDV